MDEIRAVAELLTPCKRRPEACQPRHISHVAFDADGVIWHITPPHIASNVRGPFTKIDEDTVEAGESWGYGYGYETAKPKPPQKPSEQPSLQERWWQELGKEEDRELREIGEELLGPIESKPSGKLKWVPKQQRWARQTSPGTWVFLSSGEAPPPPIERGKELSLETTPPPRKGLRWWEKPAPGEARARQYPVPPAPSAIPSPEKLALPSPPRPQRKITVKLLPTFRDTLKELKNRGITSSIISLNTPGSVKDLIAAFGLTDHFIEIRDSWENKGHVFEDITKKHKIAPCLSIFVDDTLGNVEDVAKRCAISLHMGRDITKPLDILHFISGEK